jgi:mannose/fructose-specific phosphotransferase system component IIA
MFGIILVTHGEMATGIIDAVKMIYSQTEDRHRLPIEILELKEGESPETLLDELGDRIEKMKDGGIKGVLILADLFGSSTTNAGMRIMLANADAKKVARIAVVSGLNLPMLLELIPAADKSVSIEELAKLAVDVGRKGIINIADEIAKRKKK